MGEDLPILGGAGNEYNNYGAADLADISKKRYSGFYIKNPKAQYHSALRHLNKVLKQYVKIG